MGWFLGREGKWGFFLRCVWCVLWFEGDVELGKMRGGGGKRWKGEGGWVRVVSCGFKQGREEEFWFLMLLTGLETLGIEIDFDYDWYVIYSGFS